jgi:hypothetical protein
MELDPKMVVISQAIISNIGGTATLIGDPPKSFQRVTHAHDSVDLKHVDVLITEGGITRQGHHSEIHQRFPRLNLERIPARV